MREVRLALLRPGRITRVMKYIVKGSGPMTVTYDSVQGGRAAATVMLK